MVKKKIVIPLIYLVITFAYFGFVIYQMILIKASDLIPLIRLSRNYDALSDILFAFLAPMIIMVLLALCGRIFTNLNFKIFSKFQRNYEYYYVDLGTQDHKSSKIIGRSLPAVFLALALSLFINNLLVTGYPFGTDLAVGIIMLSLLLTPISCILLLPLYAFIDCGIIKVRKKKENRKPPLIIYFGSSQYKLYKGFAGVTTPLFYIITLISEEALAKGPITYIILLYPIFLIGIFMPFFLVYEKQINKWRPKILKKLKLEPLKLEDVERNIF